MGEVRHTHTLGEKYKEMQKISNQDKSCFNVIFEKSEIRPKHP